MTDAAHRNPGIDTLRGASMLMVVLSALHLAGVDDHVIGDEGQTLVVRAFACDAAVKSTPAEGAAQTMTLHRGGEVVAFKRKP